MNLGGPELLLIIVFLAVLIIPVWALIDVASRGPEQFDAIGQSRSTWFLLLIAGIFCFGLLGIVAGLYYLLRVRAELSAL